MMAVSPLSNVSSGLLPQPCLLFLGDTIEPAYAKTAFGLRDWVADRCVGEWSCGATVSAGLPVMTPAQAYSRAARGRVIGVANAGGFSQPDVFVVCHAPDRTHVLGHPEFALPSIEEVIDLTIRLGRRTQSAMRCAGGSLHTGKLTADAANELLLAQSRHLHLPVADPLRGSQAFG